LIEFILFLVSIAIILVVSRKNLPLALFLGTFFLGLTVIGPNSTAEELVFTFTQPNVVFLALTVGIIPLIGGIMEETGQMDHLVKNLRIGKKPFLAFAPALLGMLPMPGGALMSAPLIERAGKGLSAGQKSAINVWFRHNLLLIYPLAPSLIAATSTASADLYSAITFMIPLFIFSTLLGWWFFLRKANGKIDYTEKFSKKWLLIPLAVILSAPFTDIVLKVLLQPEVGESVTAIATLVALVLAVLVGKPTRKTVVFIFNKMQPWKFMFIVFGMFFFLYVFQASPLPELISELSMSNAVLLVLIGFFLGFATGRIIVPASILVPIYFAQNAVLAMPIESFALMYFSIFLGYVITPVHPCVSVSLEYFKSELSEYLKLLAAPALIALAVAFSLAFFLI